MKVLPSNNILKEVRILRDLYHPNLISYVEWFEEELMRCIVFEFCEVILKKYSIFKHIQFIKILFWIKGWRSWK